MIGAWLLVSPWGNYPLNDDWIYAGIARRLAETGVFRMDKGCAPNEVGQALAAAPFIMLFGFSHTLLRILTMGLGLLGLVAMDALLGLSGADRRSRWMFGCVVGLNPLYFYHATTFMSELYGWVPGLGTATLWFWGRRRAGGKGPLVSLGCAAAVGLLGGAGFWTRQYAVLVFPALVLGSGAPLVFRRQWSRLRSSAPGLVLGSALWVGVILLFFPWARATGNLRPEFTDLQANLGTLDFNATVINGLMLLVYATGFCAPLLIWIRGKRNLKLSLIVASALLGGALLSRTVLTRVASTDNDFGPNIHRRFPYSANIIYDAGMGPVTLTDVFVYQMPRQRFPVWIWTTVEGLLFAGLMLWVPFLLEGLALLRSKEESLPAELWGFGVALALLNGLVFSQATKLWSFDRYFLPSVLGLALSAATLSRPVRSGLRGAICALFFLPMTWFTVAGMHDHFAWNDARWALVDSAHARGAGPANVEAGYEPNGWLAYDDYAAQRPPAHCVGPCGCRYPFKWFFCTDDSYRVGMNVLPGYQPVQTLMPHYWLTPGPPMILSVRQFP